MVVIAINKDYANDVYAETVVLASLTHRAGTPALNCPFYACRGAAVILGALRKLGGSATSPVSTISTPGESFGRQT